MCIKAEDWDGPSAAVKLRQSKSFVIICNNILITDDYRYSMKLAFPLGQQLEKYISAVFFCQSFHL